MPRFLVYLIYNLLLPVVLVVGFPSYIIKGIKRGGLARNFRQRFGIFQPELKARLKAGENLWMHAVSVGEVFVALKIIQAIHERSPELTIVLSTTTTTGYRVAAEADLPYLIVIHNPVDLPPIVARVLRLIRPAKLVLVESEIWPNLVRAVKKRGIPVVLANARLSPRSEARYRKFVSFIEPVFCQLDHATVPFETDRDRWSALGIVKDRIVTVGGVKFDEATANRPDEQIEELRGWLATQGFPASNRIFFAGSTHDGEEILAARTWRTLRESFPDVSLVIVPRHAERGAAIAAQLRDEGFQPILRSKTKDSPAPETTDSDPETVWISDTTGEQRAWFHFADAVIIGKSFTGKGGQNPVEPILAGKPVVVGPNMQNFSEVVADLRKAGGICQLNEEGQLVDAIAGYFSAPESGREQAQRGIEAMEKHRGAADRTAMEILDAVTMG